MMDRHCASRCLSGYGCTAALAVAKDLWIKRFGHAAAVRRSLELFAGFLLYGLLLHLHEAVIGVDPLGIF